MGVRCPLSHLVPLGHPGTFYHSPYSDNRTAPDTYILKLKLLKLKLKLKRLKLLKLKLKLLKLKLKLLKLLKLKLKLLKLKLKLLKLKLKLLKLKLLKLKLLKLKLLKLKLMKLLLLNLKLLKLKLLKLKLLKLKLLKLKLMKLLLLLRDDSGVSEGTLSLFINPADPSRDWLPSNTEQACQVCLVPPLPADSTHHQVVVMDNSVPLFTRVSKTCPLPFQVKTLDFEPELIYDSDASSHCSNQTLIILPPLPLVGARLASWLISSLSQLWASGKRIKNSYTSPAKVVEVALPPPRLPPLRYPAWFLQRFLLPSSSLKPIILEISMLHSSRSWILSSVPRHRLLTCSVTLPPSLPHQHFLFPAPS
ncbi:hypothetical protein CRENBAI_004013 [Crenichthys baileyi]|uniref:Uncharacterized protein n=1 Tax=Crenichthys baileyi TaxID=28760 RepID=A0AAV9R4T3_9TELE